MRIGPKLAIDIKSKANDRTPKKRRKRALLYKKHPTRKTFIATASWYAQRGAWLKAKLTIH